LKDFPGVSLRTSPAELEALLACRWARSGEFEATKTSERIRTLTNDKPERGMRIALTFTALSRFSVLVPYMIPSSSTQYTATSVALSFDGSDVHLTSQEREREPQWIVAPRRSDLGSELLKSHDPVIAAPGHILRAGNHGARPRGITQGIAAAICTANFFFDNKARMHS
jgi:hypothetical protein